jgi:trk system potassium uptake protein TrkA
LADDLRRRPRLKLGTGANRRGAVLVIGLGRFGAALATTLVELDHEVLAVDSEASRVQEYAQLLTHVVQADSTSVAALRQIGAADFDTAVVCIGTDVESSVLTAAALVDLGIGDIWAKAITAPHGRILERVGCHHVVFPEAEMGRRAAHLLTGSMLEYLALDDTFAIVETVVPPHLTGETLGQLGLRARYGVTIVSVKKAGGSFTHTTAESILEPADLIVVAGDRDDVQRFVRDR